MEFESGDGLSVGGTAGASGAIVPGGPANFRVEISGATQEATVVPTIAAVIGAMTTGSLVRGLANGRGDAILTQVIPSKKLKSRRSKRIKKKSFTTLVAAQSRLDATRMDAIRAMTKTK